MVNDGSTDDSSEVLHNHLDSVTQQYTHDNGDTVTIGSHKNTPMILVDRPIAQKQAAARNAAIELAWENADAFCQLDADDLYLSGKISKSVAAWQKSPHMIGLVYSDAVIFDERDNTRIREFRVPYDRSLLERENIISNAPLMSKVALAHTGLYDVDLPPCEDWDMWLRITENFIAIHVPEALQEYRVTGQNCTFTVTPKDWDEKRKILLLKMMERTKHG